MVAPWERGVIAHPWVAGSSPGSRRGTVGCETRVRAYIRNSYFCECVLSNFNKSTWVHRALFYSLMNYFISLFTL